jgi:hypothetical protein
MTENTETSEIELEEPPEEAIKGESFPQNDAEDDEEEDEIDIEYALEKMTETEETTDADTDDVEYENDS